MTDQTPAPGPEQPQQPTAQPQQQPAQPEQPAQPPPPDQSQQPGYAPMPPAATPPAYGEPGYTPPPYGQPAYGQPAYGQVAPYQGGAAPIGQVRSTGICILLFIVTFGIYSLYWYYRVHDDMKRHTGVGLGGGVALLLAFLVGIVMPYISSSEVGQLYSRRGQHPPVTGVTGLWYFPGALIIVGPIIWFVKTNGALNDYWRSVGAA